VPRGKLVNELAANSTLVDTRKVSTADLEVRVNVDLTAGAPLGLKPGGTSGGRSRPSSVTSRKARRKA